MNDVSEIAGGQARLVVRHTAAAPAVDVLADGSVVFSNLANPDEQMADVPAGPDSVSVAATGTTDPVIGPVDLTLEAGTAYFVYAIGSLEDESLTVVTQTISGLGAAAGRSPQRPPPAAEPTVAADDLPAAGTGPATSGESNAMLIMIAVVLALASGGFVFAGTRIASRNR